MSDRGRGSPVATGGAGSAYEHDVLARWLTACLLGNKLILPGTIVEVGAQQGHIGAYYDDVVVVSRAPNETPLEMQCQVRLHPRLISGAGRPTDLDELVALGLSALGDGAAAFAQGANRLGLICTPETPHSAALEKLAGVAGLHGTVAALVTALASKGRFDDETRHMWDALKAAVGRTGANPDMAFTYLRCLTVVRWASGGDDDDSVNQLAGLYSPSDVIRAAALRREIQVLAKRLDAAGGTLTRPDIQRQLAGFLPPRSPTEVTAMDAWREEQRRLSVGRVTARLQRLGLSGDSLANVVTVAEEQSLDASAVAMKAGGAYGLCGPVGSGKSTLAELILQQWLERMEEEGTLPLLIQARWVERPLRAVVAEATPTGFVSKPLSLVLDGLDEVVPVSRAEALLDQALAITAGVKGRLVVTSRSIPGITDGDWWRMLPPLSDADAVHIVSAVSGEAAAHALSGMPESVRDAVHRPLFAVLLGMWYRGVRWDQPRGPHDLLDHLVMSSIGRADETAVRPVLREIACATLNSEGKPVVLTDIVGGTDQRDALRASGLVRIGLDGRVGLALTLFDDYFGAEHLLLNPSEAVAIAASRARLLRWRHALEAALGRASWAQSEVIMRALVSKFPGLASTVLDSAVPGSFRQPGALDVPTLGPRLLEVADVWAEALGPLGSLVRPPSRSGAPAPLGLATSSGRMTSAWFTGVGATGVLIRLPEDLKELFGPSGSEWSAVRDEPQVAQAAWPWRWARDAATRGFTALLSADLPRCSVLRDEEDWGLAHRILGRGAGPLASPVPLGDIEAAVERVAPFAPAGLVTGRYGAWSFSGARELLERWRKRGGDSVAAPWTPPDRAPVRFVWDAWSLPALLNRLREVTAAALAAYDAVALEWFPRVREDLPTLAAGPWQLVGLLAPAVNEATPPRICWFQTPATPKDHLTVAWSLVTVEEYALRHADVWEAWRQPPAHRRPGVPTRVTEGFPSIWEGRPAADFALRLLWRDLASLGLVSGSAPSTLK